MGTTKSPMLRDTMFYFCKAVTEVTAVDNHISQHDSSQSQNAHLSLRVLHGCCAQLLNDFLPGDGAVGYCMMLVSCKLV